MDWTCVYAKLDQPVRRAAGVLHSSIGGFQEIVAPHVAPSMEYKLLARFRGQCRVVPEYVEPARRLVPAKVLDIHVKPRTRSMNRFDIEVEGNHNYFVDGVMV